MNRLLQVALFASTIAAMPVRAADVVVAPPPREVRPDGSRQALPNQDAARAKDPRETIERIINDSTAVSEKLAQTDTGAETRKKQDAILKDIKSLLEQEENPSPQSPPQDQNKDQQNQKQDNKDQQNQKQNSSSSKDNGAPSGNGGMDQPPSNQGGAGQSPSKEDRSGGTDEQRSEDQPHERRPRQQNQHQANGGEKEGKKPMPGSGDSPGNPPEKQPRQQGGGGAKDGKNQAMTPGMGGRGVPTTPSIPLEENTVKDVWGYLPDKLRQQAMQYYKQDFMPRYAKLLEHYYSSLSDKSMKK